MFRNLAMTLEKSKVTNSVDGSVNAVSHQQSSLTWVFPASSLSRHYVWTGFVIFINITKLYVPQLTQMQCTSIVGWILSKATFGLTCHLTAHTRLWDEIQHQLPFRICCVNQAWWHSCAVFGCADLPDVTDATVRRHGNNAIVRCNQGGLTFAMTCYDGKWKGDLNNNCTRGSRFLHTNQCLINFETKQTQPCKFSVQVTRRSGSPYQVSSQFPVSYGGTTRISSLGHFSYCTRHPSPDPPFCPSWKLTSSPNLIQIHQHVPFT